LSIRERIFQHLATTLASITTGAGYATTIGTVVRGHLSPLETFGLPSASIIPVDDPEDWTPQSAQHALHCMIRAWVDDTPAQAPSTLEALLADIAVALQVDTTRGGVAEYTIAESTSYIYEVSTERLCGGELLIRIDFATAISSPRVGA
jgi:hypothetical protein